MASLPAAWTVPAVPAHHTATSGDSCRRAQLGQFFTADVRVQQLIVSLVASRTGRALEPSAGVGHLAAALERARPGLGVVAVEVDGTLSDTVCAAAMVNVDFFDFARVCPYRFQVVISNPPYVAWKAAGAGTQRSAADVKARYSGKTNLYHLFIDRCVDLLDRGGEMVFIVPKEWLFATSAQPLRAKLARFGAVTHLVDVAEEKVFADAAVPALCIFRFVRGHPAGPVQFAGSVADGLAGRWETRRLLSVSDRWLIVDDRLAAATAGWGRLGDFFDVKVGLVTGLDDAFKLPDPALVEAECVQWQLTSRRQLEPFVNANAFATEADLPPRAAAWLAASRDRLLGRRIARFDESNWWAYGAVRNVEAMASGRPRFFALVKTRSEQPFFVAPDARFFTGAVLGVFARNNCPFAVGEVVDALNGPLLRSLFEAMQLTSGNKLSLQPSTLGDVPFPSTREQLELLAARQRR